MSGYDTKSNSTESASLAEDTAALKHALDLSISSIDEEDSAFIRAMTPSKRRRPTLPESPFVEPGCPVAESTGSDNAFSTSRRSRRLFAMPSSATTPEIRMQRSSRTASYVASARQKQPQTAAMSRRRSSSSHASSDSEPHATFIGDSEHFIDWDDRMDDEEEEIIIGLEKISFKSKGKDYDEFKPVNKDRLYYNIINNYQDSKMIINKWTSFYKNDSELSSICEILQLFIDIMGMQDVNVQDIYKELEVKQFKSRVHPVIEHINNLENNTTQRYLLACSTQWSKGVRNVFLAFCDAFITQCFAENILHPVTMQLNYFLTHAMDSKYRAPLLHTSALIMLIITNTFVDLIVSIKDKYGDEYTNKTMKWMLKMVIYFLNIISDSPIVTNCLRDKRLSAVRMDVMRFMTYWIKTFPALFLSEDKTFDLIKLLLIDERDLVRLEALNCCMKIISTDKQHVNFQNFKVLLFVVIQRIQDCNIKVASTALQCHTKSIERYPELNNQQLRIPSQIASYAILSKHFSMRKQGLLNLCVSIKLSQTSPKEFLIRIADVVHSLAKSEKSTFMLFLIEAVYQSLAELSKLELILEVIYSELENAEYAYYLLQIFCNSAKMQYLGYLPDIGEHAREERCTPVLKVKRTIAKLVLDNLERLLIQFDEHQIICILETLNSFSIEDFETTENTNTMKRLPKVLIMCFEKYAVGEILDEITKFFAYCLASEGFVNTFFTTKVGALCKFVTTFPKRFIYNMSADEPVGNLTEVILKNELCLEKLKNLIKNINFLEHAELAWKDIYDDWNNSKKISSINIITLQMECCQHYLTWHFKQITSDVYDDNTMNSEINILNTNTTRYIDTLVSILRSKSAKASVQNTAFECLSDLHLDIKHIINAIPLEQREEYSQKLSQKQFSDDINVLLCTFVANHIEAAIKMKSSNAKDLDLEKSRQHLLFVLRMLRCGIISLRHCPKIVRFFNDKLFDAYGDLFIKFLDNVVKDTEGTGCEAMEYIMYHTVIDVYISTTQRSKLPIIINQFNQYLRNRRMTCPKLFDLIIRYVAVKQQITTEILTLIELLLDRVTIDQLQMVMQKFLKVRFHNKNDLNVKKFLLKLNSYLPKD